MPVKKKSELLSRLLPYQVCRYDFDKKRLTRVMSVLLVAGLLPGLLLPSPCTQRMRPTMIRGRRLALPQLGVSGPPPIVSRQFTDLETPANLTAVLADAVEGEISVIKFQAPWCRTCRAMAPLLDRTAKKWPRASYYSLTLQRNGKAAGERMYKFFRSRNITQMPYVEVYLGQELLDAEVIPPRSLELFDQALGAASERLARLRVRGERQRRLDLLRDMRAQRDGRGGPGGGRRSEGSDQKARASQTDASIRQLNAMFKRNLRKASRDPMGKGLESFLKRPSRSGPPLRGATGGRRKGMR